MHGTRAYEAACRRHLDAKIKIDSQLATAVKKLEAAKKASQAMELAANKITKETKKNREARASIRKHEYFTGQPPTRVELTPPGNSVIIRYIRETLAIVSIPLGIMRQPVQLINLGPATLQPPIPHVLLPSAPIPYQELQMMIHPDYRDRLAGKYMPMTSDLHCNSKHTHCYIHKGVGVGKPHRLYIRVTNLISVSRTLDPGSRTSPNTSGAPPADSTLSNSAATVRAPDRPTLPPTPAPIIPGPGIDTHMMRTAPNSYKPFINHYLSARATSVYANPTPLAETSTPDVIAAVASITPGENLSLIHI